MSGPVVVSSSSNGSAVPTSSSGNVTPNSEKEKEKEREKEKDADWYFSAEQLINSPSRRQGIDADTELSYRQMTAYLIQEMGQRLQVSQLCINTAIVYMHRFYAFHSFTHFHRNSIASASLFLAAKVEEQPRKLEHVIKSANKCLNQPTSSTTDAYYIEQAQELVFNENVLLQTLGFDVAIDHPHTHVVKTCHLVKACKDLAQTSYFLASNSLHLTSMCLQYKPTVVACFCIYLACKWSRWESTEGKHWFHYVDQTVTMDLLKQLTDEFIAIYEKSPSRLKSKLNSIKALAQGASNRVVSKEKKTPQDEWKMGDMLKMYHSAGASNDIPMSSGSSTNSINQPSSYSNSNAGEAQQSSVTSSGLLPTPQTQPAQLRKSESHSSQHRSHQSSSHHAKIGYNSGDVIDHKSHKHQQQQSFGVNNTSSRSRDHSQTSQSHQSSLMPGNSSRSTLSSSSTRSSSSVPGQNMQRQPSQGHSVDVNYHKPREKASNSMGSFSLPAIPPPHTGHKVSQKQETNRVIQKEQSGVKLSEQGKQSNSKGFSSSSVGMLPQFVGGQLQSGPQSQSKQDMGQDLSRNVIHGQRSYGINNSSSAVPPMVYPSQHSRQNSSSKHDPSKSVSVHIQQQLQQSQSQQHNKQSIPPETAYSNVMQEQQQPHTHTQTHASANYINMRPPEAIHHEELNTSLSIHALLQQHTSAQPKPITSMFSPDYNEKLQTAPQQPQQPSGNNYGTMPAPSDAFNYKASTNTKESPKKVDREREVSMKRQRMHSVDTAFLSGMGRPSTHPQQQGLKMNIHKKLDVTGNPSELSGTSLGISVSLKRPNDINIKQDDEQAKIRKIDHSMLLSYNDMKTDAKAEINKHQVVNGIETNPDLVRNLLKESLCTSNALLKTEQLGLQPPDELFEPTVTSSAFKSITDVPDENSGAKAEKKKKKDKHKHKEKDKSKDRDERKKHKKDKDKHKDRDRGSSNSEPVKIKIVKDKIEVPSGPTESLKIKIPKDRITAEVSNAIGAHMIKHIDATSMQPAPALKIKIQKDKLENYSSGTAGTSHSSAHAHSSAQQSAGFYSSFVTMSNSSSSHGTKRKDRDRDKEREKDKKRSATDASKSNGGSSHSTMTSGRSASGHHGRGQLSKMQLLSNNMNQLFGESNDDDDDDYDSINEELRVGCAKNFKDYVKSVNSQKDDNVNNHLTTTSATMRKLNDYGAKHMQTQQQQQQQQQTQR